MRTEPDSVWVDGRDPDPAWPPPLPESPPTETGPEQTRRSQRAWWRHPALIGAAAAALALVLVGALGGFGVRSDLRVPTAVGQMITTGPYEFVFERATAQRIRRFDKVLVEVKAIGTGRTTGERAIAPTSLSGMFAARDDASREVQEASGQRFGDAGAIIDGSHFTPGLPAVPYQVVFEFSENYQPGATLRFVVAELEFTDRSLLGTGEKTWNNGDRNFIIVLPITRLPDEVD